MIKLRRFWFRMPVSGPLDSPLGYGVTAYTYDDALAVLSETFFAGRHMPKVDNVVEDVDLKALDQNHVIPNMEPPVWRGVWYPKGFSQRL